MFEQTHQPDGRRLESISNTPSAPIKTPKETGGAVEAMTVAVRTEIAERVEGPLLQNPLTLTSGLAANAREHLAKLGYVYIPHESFTASEAMKDGLNGLRSSFDDLPDDPYLKPDEGGGHRQRRFGNFGIFPKADKAEEYDLVSLPGRPYEAKYFDRTRFKAEPRHFPPLPKATYDNPFLHQLIAQLYGCLPDEKKTGNPFRVNIHQLRVIAYKAQRGQPTPEGMHDDGHDFFAVVMINRDGATGGESRIYDRNKNLLYTIELEQPLDTLMVSDRQVFHDNTPVIAQGKSGSRNVMIIGFDRMPDLQKP